MIYYCVDCNRPDEATSNRQKRCLSCKQAYNLARSIQWYHKNKDRKKSYDDQRRIEKRQLFREASRRWREAHPAEVKARVIARRSKIKNQTPKWADFKYMNLFYKIAKLEQERTGKEVHVDHIYPLTSDWVCGFHCEDNLQLLFAEDNIRKGNRNHYSLEHMGIK